MIFIAFTFSPQLSFQAPPSILQLTYAPTPSAHLRALTALSYKLFPEFMTLLPLLIDVIFTVVNISHSTPLLSASQI